jgi:hyperosmotically inducible periplasmic protein
MSSLSESTSVDDSSAGGPFLAKPPARNGFPLKHRPGILVALGGFGGKAMKIGRNLILTLALTSGVAAADEVRDAAIQTSLEEKLDSKDLRGPAVEVKDGVVTLTGRSRSVWAKTRAVELSMKTEGVVAVEDRLEIARGESDQKVAEEVAKAVNRYPYFTIYDDVNLAIENGAVTLDGRVTMPYKSEEIGARVSKVLGVQSVDNRIETLPVNIGDQKLRAALLYRIYGDSMFREYASRVNPPIHIIVERGRVALTGAVRSEVEKRKAEHIARSTFGVFAVENRLQVGS